MHLTNEEMEEAVAILNYLAEKAGYERRFRCTKNVIYSIQGNIIFLFDEKTDALLHHLIG